MEQFPSLENLDLSHNDLKKDFSCIYNLKKLTNLDFSDNPLEIEDFQPIFDMRLKCLNLINTGIQKNFKDYRKTFIHKMPSLFYLDSRDINLEDRRLVAAWGKGGKEAEKEERNKIRAEQKEQY